LGENTTGTNAQFICVPAENLFRVPKNLSAEQAASIALVFTTAWQMLVRRAQVKVGDFVLLHGVGSGVTQAGIQIARVFGAEIAVTSTDAGKLPLAKELGAKHCIDSSSSDFAKEVRKIRKAGPDIIFDHTGKVFWEKNIKCVRSGGSIVLCGATSGREGMTDLNHVFFRQIQIHGSTMGARGDFPKILAHFGRGDFKPVLDKVYPLEEIGIAHQRMADRQQNGKILISL
jgi:NADPH:quinone reductase-like Zn-dependent oxidoreductase